jgi:hypothetical protein
MKKLIILIIVNCALLIPSTRDCYSQFTWQRLYNGPYNQQDACLDLCDAGNGNFFSAGWSKKPTTQGYFVYVLKLNPLGDTIWTRIIDSVSNEALACAPSGDNGVVIVGEGHFALKLDSSGNIAWKKFYGDGGIRCYDIIRTSDGGFLACGEQLVVSGSVFRYDSYVMKLDFNGNMLWDTAYLALFDKPLKSVVEINGVGYIYTGYVRNFISDTVKCLILKADYSGDIIWEKNLKIFNRNASGNRIEKISNQFIVVGETSEITLTIGKVFLLKIDSAGNFLSTKLVNSNETVRCTDFKLLNLNRFALTSFNHVDIAKVLIIDTLGNINVERSFPTQYYTFLFSIMPLGNGDIILGGGARFTVEDADVWIIRSDSLLNFPPIGIHTYTNNIPLMYKLFQNYPNPFNPSTNIKFSIPERSLVTVKIYDLLGSEIKTLVNDDMPAGNYRAQWDAAGNASGIYFIVMQAGAVKLTKKMALLK